MIFTSNKVDCERSLRDNLLIKSGLKFLDRDDEHAFVADFFLKRMFFVQFAVFLGSIIYYVFFVWDMIIDPVEGSTTHAIRGLFVSPMIVVASVMIGFRQKYAEIILSCTILMAVVGLGIIYTLLHRGFDYGAVGAVLVLMFMFSLLPIRATFHFHTSLLSWAVFNICEVYAANARSGMILVNNMSIGAAIFLGLFSVGTREYFARREFKNAVDLKSARERVDDLLYSMLPRDIADRIQSGERNIADAHEEISIVFADLVGFTELTKRVSPSRIVDILNILFTAFDDAAEKYGVERIKTIGDAYMAICGLRRLDNEADHSVRMARFALAMQLASIRISEILGQDIKIRIGLHVGPVVAGVIGTKRPAFDCWGEAVNLASRLEHSAFPGGILISESAYQRLKDQFVMESSDDIFLKGIGNSKVFILKRPLVDLIS